LTGPSWRWAGTILKSAFGELLEDCFQLAHGAVNIGKLIEAEQPNAECLEISRLVVGAWISKCAVFGPQATL